MTLVEALVLGWAVFTFAIAPLLKMWYLNRRKQRR